MTVQFCSVAKGCLLVVCLSHMQEMPLMIPSGRHFNQQGPSSKLGVSRHVSADQFV